MINKDNLPAPSPKINNQSSSEEIEACLIGDKNRNKNGSRRTNRFYRFIDWCFCLISGKKTSDKSINISEKEEEEDIEEVEEEEEEAEKNEEVEQDPEQNEEAERIEDLQVSNLI